MRVLTKAVFSVLAIGAAVAAVSAPAMSACTRLAFSVNDYGKEGPTNDAKRLLDTYIAKWTRERGIAKYTTGPKKVTCELYLDVILFDEHTCKAEATVCWAGDVAPGATGDASNAPAGGASTPAAAEKKDAASKAKVAAPVKEQTPKAAAAPKVEEPTKPAAKTTAAPAVKQAEPKAAAIPAETTKPSTPDKVATPPPAKPAIPAATTSPAPVKAAATPPPAPAKPVAATIEKDEPRADFSAPAAAAIAKPAQPATAKVATDTPSDAAKSEASVTTGSVGGSAVVPPLDSQ